MTKISYMYTDTSVRCKCDFYPPWLFSHCELLRLRIGDGGGELVVFTINWGVVDSERHYLPSDFESEQLD